MIKRAMAALQKDRGALAKVVRAWKYIDGQLRQCGLRDRREEPSMAMAADFEGGRARQCTRSVPSLTLALTGAVKRAAPNRVRVGRKVNCNLPCMSAICACPMMEDRHSLCERRLCRL